MLDEIISAGGRFSSVHLLLAEKFGHRPCRRSVLKVVVQLHNLTLQKITAIGIFLGGCVLAVYAATETAAGNTRTLILIFAAIVGGIFIINLKENFWLILPVGLSAKLALKSWLSRWLHFFLFFGFACITSPSSSAPSGLGLSFSI